MSEPIDLDSYIARRYGVAIDQIREMDADLAEVIRWGVVIELAKRLPTEPAGRDALRCLGLNWNLGGVAEVQAYLHYGKPSDGACESVRARGPESIFPHLAHLIEAEEPAAP